MKDGIEVKNNIRTFRFHNGEMTQQELADRLGVSRQTVVAMESGKYNPSLALGLMTAKVFGVTVEEIFQLEESGDAK